MKRRVIAHPTGHLELQQHGHGGPAQRGPTSVGPPPGSGLAPKPGQPGTNPLQGAVQAIGDALGAGIAQVSGKALGGGQVLLGAVLVLAGLLLAVGLTGRAAKLTPIGRVTKLLR